MNPYDEAHLFVAAIRILSHRQGGPPSVEEVAALLEISSENGHAISRRLVKLQVVETVEDPFSVKIYIKDHLKIEGMRRTEEADGALARELESFRNKKKDFDRKVATIQEDLKKKKRDLFSDLEKKLQQEMKKRDR